VTRKLGIRLLWIDSLYISQDDEDDWKRESAVMASIFQNAYLTIAATTSADSSGGLFHSRGNTLQIDFPVEGQSQSSSIDFCTFFVYLGQGHESWKAEHPRHTRAWVLQEMFLSRRILYCGKKELMCECQCDRQSGAGFHIWKQSKMVIGITRPASESHDSSVDVVGLGRRLQLSTSDHQKDKLPAFARIADFFATSTGDVSLVGLWKSNLLTEILWEVDIRWIDSRQKRKIPGLPSCSWLPIDSPIEMQ
jgi:hypothetical protein